MEQVCCLSSDSVLTVYKLFWQVQGSFKVHVNPKFTLIWRRFFYFFIFLFFSSEKSTSGQNSNQLHVTSAVRIVTLRKLQF